MGGDRDEMDGDRDEEEEEGERDEMDGDRDEEEEEEEEALKGLSGLKVGI